MSEKIELGDTVKDKFTGGPKSRATKMRGF